MTWFKVDDTLAAHPKARAAGLPAMGLWVVSGAYCGQQLTNGHVPTWFVESWPQGKKLAGQLVAARLWEPTDGGWRFHQWNDPGRQPTRAEVEADREAARERQRKAREARKTGRDNGVSHTVTRDVTGAVTTTEVTPDVTAEVTAVSHLPRPDPTRPVSTSVVTPGGSLTKPTARDQNAPQRPNRRCPQHATLPPGAPVPDCRNCADHRRTADAWTPTTPADRPAGELLAALPELNPNLAATGAAAARAALNRQDAAS